MDDFRKKYLLSVRAKLFSDLRDAQWKTEADAVERSLAMTSFHLTHLEYLASKRIKEFDRKHPEIVQFERDVLQAMAAPAQEGCLGEQPLED